MKSSVRPVLYAFIVTAVAGPTLAQKGPSVAPEPDPVFGITLDEISQTGPNTLTLGGITVEVVGQTNRSDETTTPVFSVTNDAGELIRFDGEPSFFSFLPVTVRLVNIDPSSPQPEVIATSFTGGAHCCDRIQIAAVQPNGTWAVEEFGLFDGGYGLTDVDEDGVAEISTVDQSFLYTFDCYACSAPPPRYYNVLNGVPVDVSDSPDFIAAYRMELLRFDLPAMIGEPGRLAGWAALMARLGDGEAALETLQALNAAGDTVYEICADGDAIWECADVDRREVGFVEFLRTHLIEQGYLERRGKGMSQKSDE